MIDWILSLICIVCILFANISETCLQAKRYFAEYNALIHIVIKGIESIFIVAALLPLRKLLTSRTG